MKATLVVLVIVMSVAAPVSGYEPAGLFIESYINSFALNAVHWTTKDATELPIYRSFQSVLITYPDGSTEYFLQNIGLLSVERGPAYPWNRLYVNHYLAPVRDMPVSIVNPAGETIDFRLCSGDQIGDIERDESEKAAIIDELTEFAEFIGEYEYLRFKHRRERWGAAYPVQSLLWAAGATAVLFIPPEEGTGVAVGKTVLAVGGYTMAAGNSLAFVLWIRERRERVHRLNELVTMLEEMSGAVSEE